MVGGWSREERKVVGSGESYFDRDAGIVARCDVAWLEDFGRFLDRKVKPSRATFAFYTYIIEVQGI